MARHTLCLVSHPDGIFRRKDAKPLRRHVFVYNAFFATLRLCVENNRGELMTLRTLALCLLILAIPTPTSAQTRDERLWQRALQIHRRAIVIDTHNDVTSAMTNFDFDLSGTPPAPYRTNITRMKQGGLTGEFFSLYIKPVYVQNGGSARRTLDMIDSVYRAVERHPRDLMIGTSVADIRRAKRLGKVAALMGIEGGHAIEARVTRQRATSFRSVMSSPFIFRRAVTTIQCGAPRCHLS